MASEDDIVQRIVLEGDKAAIQQFAAVGKAGEAAFTNINKAAGATTQAFGTVGAGFANVLAGLRGTKQASEEAAAGLEKSNVKALSLAQTLRLLGRATGQRELSRLGRTAVLLGRAFAVAAPAIVGLGLGKLAAVSADTADKFADLAGSLKISNNELGRVQDVAVASGVGFDDMAKSLKAVDDITKQTAENQEKNRETFLRLKQTILDLRIAQDTLAEGYRTIARDGRNAFRDLTKAIRTSVEASSDAGRDLVTNLRNIAEQREAILNGPPSAGEQKRRALRDLDEQESKAIEAATRAERDRLEELRKTQEEYTEGVRKRRLELIKLDQETEKNARDLAEASRAMQKARTDAEQNATALEKLGVSAFQANGKLKKAPETLDAIADALQRVKDPLVETAVRNELLAAGFDRKLLPALKQGAAGLKEFAKEGARIAPPFTTQDIATADTFAKAMSQVGLAAGALADQMGLAVAPSFTGFLETLRDLLVDIRPGLTEFAKVIAEIIGPALQGLAILVKNAIVPAFQLVFKGLDFIAEKLNKAFGTEIFSGMRIFVAILIALGVAFGGLPAIILSVVTFIGLLATALSQVDWRTFTSAATTAFQFIKQAWSSVVAFFVNAWTTIRDGATAAWTWVSDQATIARDFVLGLWTSFIDSLKAIWQLIVDTAKAIWIGVSDQAQIAADFITGIFATVRDKIVGYWTSIRDFILGVWTSVKSKISDLMSSSGGPTPAVQGRAQGGPIYGPGTGTSDSILAKLSNGEWVMRTAAVRKYGASFMHAVNSLKFDPAGFNLGGLVSFEAPQPRLAYAGGGLVQGPGGTLNLSIDGQSFKGLLAPEETMDKLTRFATSRALRSAGRKPTWKR